MVDWLTIYSVYWIEVLLLILFMNGKHIFCDFIIFSGQRVYSLRNIRGSCFL